MIDKITSVFDNYSGKIKNPFIGTIISVWIIHNWRIPFALFNFDKDCTMMDKINFIADYFGKQDFWFELVTIIGISFLVLLFTFILMWVSRSITDYFYKVAEPYIITKIDEKAIFTQEDKSRLEDKIVILQNKIITRDTEISRIEESNNKITSDKEEEIKILLEQLENERNQISDLNKIISPFNPVISDFANYMPKITAETLRYFATMPDAFDIVKIKSADDIKFLMNKGILYLDMDNDVNKTKRTNNIFEFDYKLTGLGRLFVKYMNTGNEVIYK